MQQMDLFDETLEKEINNLKKWMARIQKRLWFLEQVSELKNQRAAIKKIVNIQEKQMEMFGS